MYVPPSALSSGNPRVYKDMRTSHSHETHVCQGTFRIRRVFLALARVRIRRSDRFSRSRLENRSQTHIDDEMLIIFYCTSACWQPSLSLSQFSVFLGHALSLKPSKNLSRTPAWHPGLGYIFYSLKCTILEFCPILVHQTPIPIVVSASFCKVIMISLNIW